MIKVREDININHVHISFLPTEALDFCSVRVT